VRVVAGAFRGRRLVSPAWEGLRPTSDRLRETLFNILGGRVVGARVLDGFAGTGAIGIEALSRGASHVTFVESDPRAVRLILRNLAVCRVTSAYTMMPAAFEESSGRLGGARFDLVLLDPPYAVADLGELVARAGERLEAEGWLILEHAARREAPERTASLARFRVVRSGDSALSFYRRRGDDGAGEVAAGRSAPDGAGTGAKERGT
jgi:16S rRNA (guanine(966)-N(2))-methyltransferase RsmD